MHMLSISGFQQFNYCVMESEKSSAVMDGGNLAESSSCNKPAKHDDNAVQYTIFSKNCLQQM